MKVIMKKLGQRQRQQRCIVPPSQDKMAKIISQVRQIVGNNNNTVNDVRLRRLIMLSNYKLDVVLNNYLTTTADEKKKNKTKTKKNQ